MNSAALAELSALLPANALSQELKDLEFYGTDWTQALPPKPCIIVFPRTTDEVSKVLALCSRRRIAVVPSGGRTGLAGGAVAAHGELVLNLSKMTRIDPVDLVAHTIRVQAGVVTEKLHETVAHQGLSWPVDLASKGSSQIGGNIATNAGGLRVIRYGHVRNWVQSLQVVLMSGEVLELNGQLEKNNTGYDLRHLFIGSEGTLGIVTEATLKLAPQPLGLRTFLFGVETMPKILELLAEFRRRRLVLQAFEFLTHRCFEVVQEIRKIALPLEQPSNYYVLVEVEEPSDIESLETWLGSHFEKGLVASGGMAQSSSEARHFWSIRENITESLRTKGKVYKNDLAVPLGALPEFTKAVAAVAPRLYPACELFLFGHIGDGNVHVNVLKNPHMKADQFLALCEGANPELFEIVRRHGGSIAAEHGIGLLKKAYLSYSRAPSEIVLLKAIKAVFDPQQLLNPGKIF